MGLLNGTFVERRPRRMVPQRPLLLPHCSDSISDQIFLRIQPKETSEFSSFSPNSACTEGVLAV